ncbi:MAG: D-alanine--D-alanine ligase [Pseudomonadota bacterium]
MVNSPSYKALNIGVLMGGKSAEREVSLMSGKPVLEAIDRLGYHGYMIDPVNGIESMEKMIAKQRPDVIFNALHGRYGEDGTIQAWLDLHGLIYTHSPMRASVLAFDKHISRIIAHGQNIQIPDGLYLDRATLQNLKSDPMPRPFVLKPVNEGSSVGVMIYKEDSNMEFPPKDWCYQNALIERFITGKELTTSVLGNQAFGVTELRPKQNFYNYESKYQSGMTEHILPADIDPQIAELCCKWALKMHHALECKGATRCDFRYDDQIGYQNSKHHGLYFLEINTQPGLTELSLVPEQAKYQGMGFDTLIDWMIKEALKDK